MRSDFTDVPGTHKYLNITVLISSTFVSLIWNFKQKTEFNWISHLIYFNTYLNPGDLYPEMLHLFLDIAALRVWHHFGCWLFFAMTSSLSKRTDACSTESLRNPKLLSLGSKIVQILVMLISLYFKILFVFTATKIFAAFSLRPLVKFVV